MNQITTWLISLVSAWGLIAIFVTMAGESAGLPISSEIVVPLGGALASQGKLNFVLVVAVSSLVGKRACPTYAIYGASKSALRSLYESLRQELHVNLPVGGWRWFDFALRPVRNSQGVVTAIVPEAMELTERKQQRNIRSRDCKLPGSPVYIGLGTAGAYDPIGLPLSPIMDNLAE